MNNIPAPVLFAFIALIAWPLIQLISVLVVRSSRVRLKALAAELQSDPKFTDRDREAIEEELIFARAGRGDPMNAVILAVTPLILPLIILGDALRGLSGHQEPPSSSYPQVGDRIGSDVRFRQLHKLSTLIGWIRRPVAAFFAMALSLPILPLSLLVFGLRGTSREIQGAVSRFMRVAAHV
ncbi:hypothetical protein [Microvirga sp. CF3016]|uniref:hypothetical protein n=1 Tax=Microvirga sp. CF3016 TaxID=3110181 RepID=UPI002E79AAE8|nr:hypothetical protein [Microvirga sp. CF3016]MEE1611159.1 hypothetical protein [Microvirga sp. CF3016]